MAARPALDERLATLACPVDHTMLDPAVQDSPWDFYDELHEKCPVFPMPEIGAVMVTKYEDVRVRLDSSRAFFEQWDGAAKGVARRPTWRSGTSRSCANAGWGHVETLQRTDPPDPHRIPAACGEGIPPQAGFVR